MKTTLMTVATALLALAAMGAQSDPARDPRSGGPASLEAKSWIQITVRQHQSYRLTGKRAEVGGTLVRAFKSGHPWQLINPFAPVEYGNGVDNVVVDPTTGRPEAIRLLTVSFP